MPKVEEPSINSKPNISLTGVANIQSQIPQQSQILAGVKPIIHTVTEE